MASRINTLIKKGLLPDAPSFLRDGVQYEVMMGSIAYGCSSDMSDTDLYGFCMPLKEHLFPSMFGEIEGFGKQLKRFNNFQKHHVKDEEARIEYDMDIYSIARYFQLCSECNPNMIDSMFVPIRCILWITPIGQKVRDNRHLFLHKGAFHKFKGYAYSQLHKCAIKTPEPGSKRAKVVEEFGWDVKFGYHVARLALEAEQMLTEGDLDLERNRELLKAIRRGEWTIDRLTAFFQEKEKALEKLYNETNKLPYEPDMTEIKKLLIECINMHYQDIGALQNMSDFDLERYYTLLEELRKMGPSLMTRNT